MVRPLVTGHSLDSEGTTEKQRMTTVYAQDKMGLVSGDQPLTQHSLLPD